MRKHSFASNLILLVLTQSWEILICPVHIHSADPIWIFHWKSNLTCSIGICWFVREKSSLVKIKEVLPETDEVHRMVYSGRINLVCNCGHSAQQWAPSISWTRDWEFAFRAKTILFTEVNTLKKKINQVKDTKQEDKSVCSVLKKFSIFAFCRP